MLVSILRASANVISINLLYERQAEAVLILSIRKAKTPTHISGEAN